jgi:hypothetical protein
MAAPHIELPSGLWAGHYVQYLLKHPQEMTLEFADGLVRGDGRDGLGVFTVDGEYRVEGAQVRLGWVKTYEGSHSVLYLGKLEAHQIVGRWSLSAFNTGSFLLSPATPAETYSQKGTI